MAASRALRALRNREILAVLAAVLVTAIVMFTSIGEQFTPGDLNRIRSAEAQLLAACRPPVSAVRASASLGVLLRYDKRSPNQPLPLHGAGAADSMNAELTTLQHLLSTTACAVDSPLESRLTRTIAAR